MDIDDFKHVAIIGAGDMGHGIAEVALMAGYTVTMYDISEEFVENGKNRIDWSLKKLADKSRIGEGNHLKFMGNLLTSIEIIEAVNQADLVIEAAPEILDVKQKIFRDLDSYSPKHAILASNTSNMSINDIASATQRPEKVCGLHFFNPPVLMRLVEITKGKSTSAETVKLMTELAEKMQKTPVVCQKDSPGFIANRINAPVALYMQLLLANAENNPAAIDAAAMQMGLKMGPYELADYTGLDILYHSLKYLEQRLSPDFKPPVTLEQLVLQNKLGKKTGEGIYKWPEQGRPEIDRSNPADFDLTDLLKIHINEATKVLAENLATAKDIDTAMKFGFNNPIGPFEFIGSVNLAELTVWLDGLSDNYGLDLFKAHEWIRNGTIIDRI